jgi:PIN domain nuclease of toxin-antitoxin system
MPAHGWFEVWCNLKRISSVDRTYLPPFFAGKMQLPLELIHIDDQFIKKYGNINIPYSKGADHIFIVVAYENQYPLITWDDKMRKIAKKVGVQVYDPKEYLQGF